MHDTRRQEFGDLYELLEVSPRASQDVIQAAYRALVRNYHPDLNPSAAAQQRIRQLNAAYQVLTDPQERARYDLECARARRHERLVQPPSPTTLPTPRRAAALVSQPTSGRRAAIEPLPLLNAHAIAGLLLVVVLAAVTLILLWSSLDAPDTAPAYVPHSQQQVEIGAR
jgi:hypothetical protein